MGQLLQKDHQKDSQLIHHAKSELAAVKRGICRILSKRTKRNLCMHL